MLKKLYIHNYKCFLNFELIIDKNSTLLIGKNGVGKSTIANVLQVFQMIGNGEVRVGNLIKPKDFCANAATEQIMRLEIECEISDHLYKYSIALELPQNFHELRIFEESLVVDKENIFTRKKAEVQFWHTNTPSPSVFSFDWHMIALPLISDTKDDSPINIFRNWIKKIHVLSPIPKLISGESKGTECVISRNGENFASYLTGILQDYPASYSTIFDYFKSILPDFKEFKNPPTSSDTRNIEIIFEKDGKDFELDFCDLSDGEKCYFLCAAILAYKNVVGDFLLFWDEPDNYLSLAEIEQFVRNLRKSFTGKSQFIASAHSEETVRCFSRENILLIDRNSHLEPPRVYNANEKFSSCDDIAMKMRLNEIGD